LASKVELPPVRGAGYEPAIVILSQSQRETSAFDGAVVVLWSSTEASLPSVDGDDVALTEQRTTIKTLMKTIRRTTTWIRRQALDHIDVEPMPSRTTGHLWGVLQNFHWRVWEARARRTSPKGPVEALVNRYDRSSR